MKSLALFQCSTTFKPRKDRLSGAAELGERLVGRVLDKCQVEPTLEKIAALPEELGELTCWLRETQPRGTPLQRHLARGPRPDK